MDVETKLDVKMYNISLLTITPPKKTNGGYNLKILYNNKNFNIQSPLCKIVDINYNSKVSKNNYIILSFIIGKNFNHFQFFGVLEHQIVEEMGKYFKNSKYDILNETGSENLEDVVNININRIKEIQMTVKVKILSDVLFFNKEKTEISGKELEIGDKVVLILKTNGIFCDSKSASLAWKTSQILKF